MEAAQREADDARGHSPGQDRNPKGGRPYKRAYEETDEKRLSEAPMVGSKRSWDSGDSAYEAWPRRGGEWDLVCLALNLKRLQQLLAV